MTKQQNYQEAVKIYILQLRNLYIVPEKLAQSKSVTRAAATIPSELLVERVEQIVESSQTVGEMTTTYLECSDQAQREASEIRILAQAIASLELVKDLLERAEAEEEGSSVEVTRSGMRGSEFNNSIKNLINLLETPIEAGISSALMQNAQVRSDKQRPNDVKQAKADLEEEVESSLSAICEQTSAVGWKAATNLVLMDAAALRQGLEFVSKDAAHLIDEIMVGVGSLILRLVKAAIRLLAQVYNWIQSLLGKEIEIEARQQVGKWLEDLKQEQPTGKFAEGFFGQLVIKIYNPNAIQEDIKTWVAATQVEVDRLNQAAEIVENLAKKHEVRAKQIDRILTIIAFVKKIPAIKTPQGQVITAAVLLGVLVYTLSSGYDHIRDGQIVLNERFSFGIPNRIIGVHEVVQQALEIVKPPTSITTAN
ncbi:hypothetical protein H6G97_36455 [Nostoc flagelliforme FACHB-838]|uniref:Uncharacterized protein n=1 Tax=Nostoc flagelliforme FACHB-838 TaxID=2692904 RepID=A0ABR8E291_9NOSO|nr:hypothetical protein [Nostoc flagelliforme]MBD2534675.1 hypothetical protein [Nostoc flagelliforme FACHB-838]